MRCFEILKNPAARRYLLLLMTGYPHHGWKRLANSILPPLVLVVIILLVVNWLA
jgi:hypothetical protein